MQPGATLVTFRTCWSRRQRRPDWRVLRRRSRSWWTTT